jgi:hypothetical protein
MQQYTNNLTDPLGNVVPFALATISDSTGALALLYADKAGVVRIDNPVKADGLGRFSFYAANGRYTGKVSGASMVSADIPEFLLYDPADDPHSVTINAGATVTINVPAQYPSMQAALDAVRDWIIHGTLTIQFADGTYVHTAGVLANHLYGRNIRIVGNEATPGNCVIQVANAGFDCFVATNGCTVGYLNGFTLRKTVKALAADNSTAILALGGARIICGTSVVVDNWYYGIAARDSGYIYAPSARVDHAGDVGIWAMNNSTIDCQNAVSNNAADVANNWGFGIQAEYGSVVDCSGASATGCRIAGIASLSNSSVRALAAIASGNTGSGFLARDGSTIECHGATASTNTRYGVEAIADGHVYYSSITTAGNTLGNFASRAYFDNGALGARLVADDGPLRIDTSTTNSIYFNTPNGLQFEVADSGVVTANHPVMRGSAAGSKVQFAASGSDTNIDLALSPKGTGVVQFGALTVNADAPVTGYITIRDAGGTLRKLAVIA